MEKSNSKRIGFYIRVSTEEQAENPEGSIKNQEERLKQMVKLKNMDQDFGDVTEIFIDRAKSGKDTNRPELQRMLEFIRGNKLDLIMTTELSRISRSIRDFSEIWELMQLHKCGLMCLRENFDTETAAGEMVLYTLANIAQFERRQVSERVAANMKSRAERGLYNGGTVPMGFKLIDGKPGYLDIDEEQARVVQKAFEAFLAEGSLSKASRWLNDNGYRLKRLVQGGGRNMRLDHFTVDNLHKMLTNPMYMGLKRFKDKGEVKTVKAVWEPIIKGDLYERVDEVLKKNHSRKKPHSKKRYPYLLSGITFCKCCGDHLSGKSAHGSTKKIGYYEHSWRTKRNSSFSAKTLKCENYDRVPASKLEALVCEKVEALLSNKELGKELVLEAQKKHKDNSQNKEVKSVKAKISGVTSQLDALAERLSELPAKVSAQPIYKQMEKLEGHKELYQKQLQSLKEAGAMGYHKPIQLEHYNALLKALKGLWSLGDPPTRSKIIQWLIHKIEVGRDSVVLHYQLGESNLLRELASAGSRLFLCLESNFANFFKGNSSNTLTIGAPEWT